MNFYDNLIADAESPLLRKQIRYELIRSESFRDQYLKFGRAQLSNQFFN